MSDELELLQRWRDGDDAAGETLARTHYREIFDYLRKRLRGSAELAAELTQQVFEVAAGNREDIVTDFRRYLYGVARFKLWEHFRRNKPGDGHVDPRVSRMIEPGHGAFSMMLKEEEAKLLVRALRSLSMDEQAYLMWAYADRLSHPEIAHKVGLNTAQINGRIHRARDKVRRWLDEQSRSPEQSQTIDKGFNTWMISLRHRVDDAGHDPKIEGDAG